MQSTWQATKRIICKIREGKHHTCPDNPAQNPLCVWTPKSVRGTCRIVPCCSCGPAEPLCEADIPACTQWQCVQIRPNTSSSVGGVLRPRAQPRGRQRRVERAAPTAGGDPPGVVARDGVVELEGGPLNGLGRGLPRHVVVLRRVGARLAVVAAAVDERADDEHRKAGGLDRQCRAGPGLTPSHESHAHC